MCIALAALLLVSGREDVRNAFWGPGLFIVVPALMLLWAAGYCLALGCLLRRLTHWHFMQTSKLLTDSSILAAIACLDYYPVLWSLVFGQRVQTEMAPQIPQLYGYLHYCAALLPILRRLMVDKDRGTLRTEASIRTSARQMYSSLQSPLFWRISMLSELSYYSILALVIMFAWIGQYMFGLDFAIYCLLALTFFLLTFVIMGPGFISQRTRLRAILYHLYHADSGMTGIDSPIGKPTIWRLWRYDASG